MRVSRFGDVNYGELRETVGRLLSIRLWQVKRVQFGIRLGSDPMKTIKQCDSFFLYKQKKFTSSSSSVFVPDPCLPRERVERSNWNWEHQQYQR
jgi:hypothetical protein